MSGSIGLDLSERGVTAVLLDAAGSVVKHASAEGDGVAKALKQVGGTAAVRAVGVSIDAPQARPDDKQFGGKTPLLCSPGAAVIVAETSLGAARGARNAICLWIGDRVFAGLMLDGRPWAGAHGLAGSAAWLALNPVERQDYRKLGSLAAEVSHTGIANRLSWRIQSGDHSDVLERAGNIQSITAAHVFESARDGDGVAISVVRDTARYVGMAIVNLASAIDPEVIVLAGPLADAGDLLMDPIRQECARRLSPAVRPHFRLELSTLGVRGIAIGAARLASAAA
ncbi:MAG TPA: ROK family protein [Vicinamibacterales bacterium]|nr:ROK family protein [Vicinamibacterales bacterium]